MDQTLDWWAHALLEGWQDRPGPRYARLAATMLDAVEMGRLRPGTRLPAERILARALGISRGTMVACYDHMVEAGVVSRRHGAGTFVLGKPGWHQPPTDNPAAALLLRRFASADVIDLSLSVPAGTSHLPPVRLDLAATDLGLGLDPTGLLVLRQALARDLTERHALPTDPDELVITSGAQQALSLLAAALGGQHTSVITGCPTYPGLPSAFEAHHVTVVGLPDDAGAGGLDPRAVERQARAAGRPLLYLAPNGSNPTGTVLSVARREGLLAAARASRATIVEDLALADLILDGGGDDGGSRGSGGAHSRPRPLAADHPDVIAIGSLSKVFWAGLRVGWIRAGEPLRSELVRRKAADDLGSSVPSQALAAELLASVTPDWYAGLRLALRSRRDCLIDAIGRRLPAWVIPHVPEAGLSLWIELPVHDAQAFADRAATLGVLVAPGRVLCVCGRHHQYARLSYAAPLAGLELAVERLALAWESHAADLAATPVA